MKRSSTEARACDAFEDCGIVNIIHLKVDIIESIRDNLTHTALNSEPTKQPFPECTNNTTNPRAKKYPQARTTLPHEASYSFDPKLVTNRILTHNQVDSFLQQTQGHKSIPKPGLLCRMKPTIHLTQNSSRIEFDPQPGRLFLV
jgi:hypothetical protein